VTLSGCERPQFLCYRTGDFFHPHRDARDEPDAPDFLKARRLSVVLFLNDEADEAHGETYSGGALTFGGLIPNPPGKTYGFPLRGENGLLTLQRE